MQAATFFLVGFIKANGKRSYRLILCFLLANGSAKAEQDTMANRSRPLPEITIHAYLSGQRAFHSAAAVSVLQQGEIKRQPDHSFVTALNTVPGLRAEERSPGSYRLSIRGSLLRSPFGIRNVKIYLDEVPLTDAGGNTYLNALDIGGIDHIEILKGPDGSLFGANSGGVLRLSSFCENADSNRLAAGLSLGSFGFWRQQAAVQQVSDKNQLNIYESVQHTDGYRENSAMRRYYIQVGNKWAYAKGGLSVLALFSDLEYQTPGGLTREQMEADPRAARQPTASLPGAVEQQAAIRTQLALLALTNKIHITKRLKNVTVVFGNRVGFENPFITNYEQREETSYGLRSYFTLESAKWETISWEAALGLEAQQTRSLIGNYGNNRGKKDTLQSKDDLYSNLHFLFARYSVELHHRLHAEAALSLNAYGYAFQNRFPLEQQDHQRRRFPAQWMPKLAISYAITPNILWRVSWSRGYSTPTTAEVRPTDNRINTSLRAEYGWNYETGLRLRNADATMLFDLSVFYYKLEQAIVRRLHPDETEYYLNAGGTDQQGLELYFSWWVIRSGNAAWILRGLQWTEAWTYSRFSFRDYRIAGSDYSGNRLTGVPPQTLVSGLQLDFPAKISLFLRYNYTAKLPLNDANTEFAAAYHLLQARVGWQQEFGKRTRIMFYLDMDNLLNAQYSLGNDLNATGNRYYNPAPARNYTIGMNLSFY